MKTYSKIQKGAFFIFASIFLISCSGGNLKQETGEIKADSLSNKNKLDESRGFSERDSLLLRYNGMRNFTYTKTISRGEITIELETQCLNDTLASTEDSDYEDAVSPLLTRPVIVGQILKFKRNGTLIKDYIIPIKKVVRTNYIGNKIECLEQNIWCLYFIEGENDTVIGISGSGLCEVSECPEFIGLYSEKGDVIYEFSTTTKNEKSLDEVLKKYKINKSTWKKSIDGGLRTDIFWLEKR